VARPLPVALKPRRISPVNLTDNNPDPVLPHRHQGKRIVARKDALVTLNTKKVHLNLDNRNLVNLNQLLARLNPLVQLKLLLNKTRRPQAQVVPLRLLLAKSPRKKVDTVIRRQRPRSKHKATVRFMEFFY